MCFLVQNEDQIGRVGVQNTTATNTMSGSSSPRSSAPTFSPNMRRVHRYNKLKDKKEKVKLKGKTVTLYHPQRSTRATKKLKVYVRDPKSGEICTVHFGHPNYEDYTTHQDDDRRRNYCARSKGMCQSHGCDVTSANFWSRMVLWNCGD